MNNREILDTVFARLDKMSYIKDGSIPDIPLYMDQVTTFMNEHLASNKRLKDEKILTKTMINNYTKNRLIPPPLKKKYSKEHILLLIFIYYYKNVLGFADIEAIFKPITDKYFVSGNEGTSLLDIYNECLHLEKSGFAQLKADILSEYERAEQSFAGHGEEDREYLRLFAFISELAFDIYVKKQVIEQIIDSLSRDTDKAKRTGKSKKER